VPVAGGEGCFDGRAGLVGRGLEDAESEAGIVTPLFKVIVLVVMPRR
jgi:hypothetical protein